MIFKIRKDGGPESHVWGLFVCEFKKLFSIVILRFGDGSRDAYHNHAFNAWSWVLKGKLIEQDHTTNDVNIYTPNLIPISTPRDMFHKVTSVGTTWVITFRGPWADTWQEYIPVTNKFVTMTHGRKVV